MTFYAIYIKEVVILFTTFFTMWEIFTLTNILIVILLITLYRGFKEVINLLEIQHQETLEKIDSVKWYLHYLYWVIKWEEDNDEEDNDEDIDKK